MPNRKPSEDSLYDPSYPDMTRGSGSQPRRTSSRSSGSSASNLSEGEAAAWRRSISLIHSRAMEDDEGDFSPRAPAPAEVRDSYVGARPTSTFTTISSRPTTTTTSTQQTGGWGVAISPTRPAATYRAPPPAPSSPIRRPPSAATSPIRVTSPNRIASPIRADPDQDEYTHLPSFNHPSPGSQISPTAIRKASMSVHMPMPRPNFGTNNSGLPLMADTSAVNTPNSPLGDPFTDRMQSAPVPATGRAVSGSFPQTGSVPPRIHINSIPASPATPPVGAFAAPPIVAPTSYGSSYPFTSNNAPSSDTRDSSTGQRRPSQGTVATQISGVSVTSALDSKNGRLTMAERRNQRMKQVMGKKGKKERDVKGAAGAQINRQPFKSTRLKEEIYKPWLEKKDPAQRWARWITLLSVFLGLAVMAIICWDGYNSVPRLGNLCSVMNEDFSNGLDTNVWTREVRVDGFGHGAFDYTTDSTNNSFVQDKTLYIVPTLTSDVIGEDAIQNGYTLNLTQAGTCTSTNVTQCVAVSNSSQLTVINPVMSARLTTRLSANIRYGKIEVVARFPTGDWLWPSISMYPVNETYGIAPRSGEIDIITGRGNNASYTQRGVDYAQSTLHWGPTYDLDRSWQTWGYREQRRSAYNQGFRTFGFEWNENYMWTYIDSRVSQVVSLRFDQSFWNRGKFPSTITNKTSGDVVRLINPWINSPNNNAPFDQPFYLSLSLAVGATDGWFPDGEGGKPWLDNSLSAMSDFWNAKNKWWNAWPSDPKTRGFAIKSVKMWKTC